MFGEYVDMKGYKLHTSISIGILVYLDSGYSGNTHLKNADIEMYTAKERQLYHERSKLAI